MSSGELPTLRLEIEPDWALVSALFAWAGVLLVCLSRTQLSWWVLFAVATLIAGEVVRVFRTQLGGGSRRALAAITWARDGGWVVGFADGSEFPARLATASRPLPFGALLALDSVRGRHWLLLRANGRNHGELRRLRVRMRLAARRTRPHERREVAHEGS